MPVHRIHPRIGRAGRRLLHWSVRVAGLLLLGCATGPSAAPGDVSFRHYELATGTARHQTVLTGFFRGGENAELIVLHVARNGARQLLMYGFGDSGWEEVSRAPLRPGILFVDVARINGRDRLLTYEAGRLNWFDPATATEQPIAELTIRFTRSGSLRIPHLDVTGDVNGDGLDDLVIPDLNGFWISTQKRDGRFSEMQQMGPAEPYRDEPGLTSAGIDQSRSYGDVGISEFTLPLYRDRLHALDVDQDGRRDLLFWNSGHFDVYRQDTSGSFSPVSRAINADVPIDSEGIYSRSFDFSDDGVLSFLFGFNEKSQRTVLYTLRDLNGDGVADLVTLTLAGRSLARQSSRYRVYFGAATATGIAFDRDNSVELKPRGRAAGMQPWGYASQSFRDFDADGDVDIMLRHVRVGFGGMGRALVGRSVALDLEFFRMADGGYPADPVATRKIRPRFDLFGKGVFLPPVMLGDIDGDRHADLLVGKSPDELDIYRGVAGAGLFTRRPQTVSVSLPDDERNSWLAHLNRDRKSDIVVYHPSDTGSHRLITLIAR